MKVIIKGRYTILGEICSNSEEFPVKINCPTDTEPKIIIEIEINTEKQSVEAFGGFEVSDELWDFLSKKRAVQEMSDTIKKEASFIKQNLIISAERVLNAIKYYFKHFKLEEELFSTKGTFWSIDKKNWEALIFNASRKYIKIMLAKKLGMGHRDAPGYNSVFSLWLLLLVPCQIQ